MIAINLVDVAIVIAVLIGLGNGYQRGFWLSIAQYAGLVAGVVAGAAAAPALLDALGFRGGQPVRPLAAILVLVLFGSIGSSAGYWLGGPIRTALAKNRESPGRGEAGAGALLSGAAVLAVAWFLGLSLDRAPLAGQFVQSSSILRRVDAAFPRPPAFLAGVETLIAAVPFPQTFAGLAPSLPGALAIPASVDTAGVQVAQRATVRVEGRGCGGTVTGSGFPFARAYVVTNAHVVSGTNPNRELIYLDNGRQLAAHVVLFDPQRDVAVLWVPGLALDPLPFGPAQRGTQGAVIGYPGGGPEDVQPAVVDGTVRAEGRDIYNQNLVDRQIWVIESNVRPGNSGGPLVDLGGKVIGLIFAASSSNPQQAYALTDEEFAADLQRGGGLTATVNTAQYPCAV